MVKRVHSQSTDTRNQKQKPTPTATQDAVLSSAVTNPSTFRDATLAPQVPLNTRDNGQYLGASDPAPPSQQTMDEPMDVDKLFVTEQPRSLQQQSFSLRKVINPPFGDKQSDMDEMILRLFHKYPRTGPPPDFRRMALFVVLTCEELDKDRSNKTDDFDGLLQSYPVLDQISKEGSFQALRELGQLQYRPCSSLSHRDPSEIFWRDPDKLLSRGTTCEYHVAPHRPFQPFLTTLF